MIVGSDSLIKCRWRLMVGFPVYIVLHLVISITPLLKVHPCTAALWEWGRKGWFGQMSQEGIRVNGLGVGGERGGIMWELLHHTVQAQPPVCLLSSNKPTIHFPEMCCRLCSICTASAGPGRPSPTTHHPVVSYTKSNSDI